MYLKSNRLLIFLLFSLFITFVSVQGQQLAELVNGNLSAGSYKVTVNAQQLPSGIYIYQLKTGEFKSVKRMLLLK